MNLLSATTSILSPSPITKPRSPLAPSTSGAPLANDTTLIPQKYLSQTSTSFPQTNTTGYNHRPALNLRSPPSTLLDAPGRAALNMPNGLTASGQARAVRGGEAKTPEYELDQEEYTPLLAPTPGYPNRPGISRSSSTGSTTSTGNRGILRRIFIDRATTPTQHLTRPTFPPPSSSTYSPLPPSPLTISSKVNLFINQTISILLSTVFLTFVVAWALFAEITKGLPKWVWRTSPKVFPWDDQKYWQKEGRKVSKDPSDYARQVGMDIEHQTVETEDGYYLK